MTTLRVLNFFTPRKTAAKQMRVDSKMTQNNLPADAPPPRLCVVEKLAGETEYGYNLHAEKERGQFVGIVDSGSPAERGGLIQGDRIFAVNGQSIIGDNHKKVVAKIKSNPNRCEMLVIDEEGAKWYADHNIQITLDLPNIHRVSEKNSRSNGSPPPSTWYAPSSYMQSASKSTQETPVFVPPPPPTTEMHHHHQPKPRIARLVKNSPLDEFGFNLHAEKNLGHFIGTVDEGGIGEKAGLVMGQRIVGVNGQLVYPNTPHKEVVALIKKSPLSTTLLVASEDVDKWHRENGVEYVFSSAEEFNQHHHEVEHHNPAKSSEYEITPVINPHSIQVNEEREVSKTVTSTKTEITTTNTNAYQYKEPTTTHYDAYASPPTDDDIMNQVFAGIDTNLVVTNVTIHSDTQEHSVDASSVSSFSSHRESAVDVPVNQQYVPSYNSQSHLEDNHHHHHHSQTHQQPSPLSNGSSHGYAASSTSGYDDDDIYHLSAKEARERLRMKNRKPHLHEMSINEKYQLVSNM